MNFVNGGSSLRKQGDKIDLTIRISSLTLLSIKFDYSSRYFRLEILNLALETNKKGK